MHKILSCPDILDEIFSYTSRQTTIAAAQVCRVWSTSSTRFIWDTVELNDALNLIPMYIFDECDKISKKNSGFKQQFSGHFLDRFSSHCKYIRCLKCSDIQYPALKKVIAWWSPTEVLSPRLRVIHWTGEGTHIQYLFHLLTSTLQHLDISLDNIQSSMADCLCEQIVMRSPFLRVFQLNISSMKDHVLVSRLLSGLLPRLPQLALTIMPARFMTSYLFMILSRLPNLKGLMLFTSTFKQMEYVETIMEQKDIVHETTEGFPAFNSLENFHMSDLSYRQAFTISQALKHGIQFLKLRELVCSPGCRNSNEITNLMESVHIACPNLQTIIIRDMPFPTVRFPGEAIQALLKCPYLHTLKVVGRTVDIRLHDIITVAINRSFWQTIILFTSQPFSYRVLVPFAQNCPELVELGLTLDSDPELSNLKTDVWFSSLRTLNVGDMLVASPVQVGIFLSKICGEPLTIETPLKNISSWKTVEDIVNSVNETARVRMLNKELSSLRVRFKAKE